MEAELEKEARRLDRIADLLEQGVYSVDEYLRRKDSCVERTRTLSNALEALDEGIAEQRAYDAQKRDLAPQVASIVEKYREIPDAKQKNVLLKAVIEKIVYHKLARRGFDLTVFPRLPR